MKKVLIVEDDSIVAHIYKTRLEKEGYEVEIAPDGQSGFYRIHEFEPDAVLLDLMLPKMNGVEILKKIRAQAKFGKIPIVVFTNAYVANMINESFVAGATMVFNKATLTPRQILDSLHNALHPPAQTAAAAAQTDARAVTAGASQSEPERFDAESWSEGSFHSGQQTVKVDAPPAPSPAPAPAAASPSPAPVYANQVETHSSAAVMAHPDPTEDEDSEFQADLLKSFLESSPELLVGLRKITQDFSKAQDDTSRLANLLELYRKVHALTGSAGIAGLRNISKMAAAVEVLLKDLYEKP